MARGETESRLEDFEPLHLEINIPEPQWKKKEEPQSRRQPPVLDGREGRTVSLKGRAPRLENNSSSRTHKAADGQRRRPSNTYVPPRTPDLDDMFMDDADEYDAYDDYDDYGGGYGSDRSGYEYDDALEGSFFMRHIRGIIGVSLLAVLALIFTVYAFSEAGQTALAQFNLAWNAETYSRIGYDYYQSGQYDAAGSYYEKALARDPDSYAYASSAAMAYVTGENTDKAAMMLKKCIEINPAMVEPYIYLLNLYPDSASRPWDVTQLLQQGYQQTGDERLRDIN